MADEKNLSQQLTEAKAQIASGVVSPASELSVKAAETVQKLSGFSALIQTPTGLAAIVSIITAIGSAIAVATGAGGITTEKTVKIEIVKWPEDLHIVASQETAPVKLPVVAKPFGIVTFSAKVPPLDKEFWDKYRAKGYRIDHYGNEGAEIQDWAALIQKSGGYPCIIVTDTKNYLGGGPLVDADKTAALISKYEKVNP